MAFQTERISKLVYTSGILLTTKMNSLDPKPKPRSAVTKRGEM
jgi:hypothetical protein